MHFLAFLKYDSSITWSQLSLCFFSFVLSGLLIVHLSLVCFHAFFSVVERETDILTERNNFVVRYQLFQLSITLGLVR